MFENNKKIFGITFLIFTAFVLTLFLINLNAAAILEDRQSASLDALTYFQEFSLNYFDAEAGGPSEESFTEKDMEAYRVVVFNGWGPWCTSCTGEMPDLQALAEEYEKKGLLLVGVVAGYFSDPAANSDESIASTLAALGISYPILVGDERFSEEVEPTMGGIYPGTWAVDSEGNLIEFVTGAIDEENWRVYFDKWLEE